MRKWVCLTGAAPPRPIRAGRACARAVTLLALVAMVMGTGCRSEHVRGGADLSLQGRAELVSASGKKTKIFRSLQVGPGETVRILAGSGVLDLGDHHRLELRSGSAVKVGTTPTLVAGDLLMIAESGTVAVKAAGSTVEIKRGAARVTRALAVDAATYEGTTTITSTGRRFRVPALRQATIASLGVLPAKAEPLRLNRTDAWDRRYLGDAIELTEQLQARSDGLSGQLPTGQGRSAGFFETLLPELSGAPGFTNLVDANRAPGETLVGASIALVGKAGTFGDRWRSLFTFRDEGAAWGLVALDQRVRDVPMLSERIDAAMARAQSYTLQVAGPSPGSAPATRPPATAPNTPAPKPTVPPRDNGPRTSEPPPPTTVPSPATDAVDTVGDVVSGLVSSLLGQ